MREVMNLSWFVMRSEGMHEEEFGYGWEAMISEEVKVEENVDSLEEGGEQFMVAIMKLRWRSGLMKHFLTLVVWDLMFVKASGFYACS